jgi:molybdopterin-guanine dinucleotide biosynthesis protein MobB
VTETGPRLVAFAAPSGTGKTTLICSLIEELRAQGLRVGAIKSDAHRVELDTPGKDTHRMRKSGSLATALVSRDQIAFFRDGPGRDLPLEEIVALFFRDLDLVIAEGFRSHRCPTLVVRRSGVSMEGWQWPGDVVAIVSDTPEMPGDLPRFALDDVAGIARFLRDLLPR